MPISDLPPELCLEIAQHLLDPDYNELADLREIGLNLALVSKQWTEIGTQIAWKEVELTNDEVSVVRDVQHIGTHVGLARFIRRLNITSAREPMLEEDGYVSGEQSWQEEEEHRAISKFCRKFLPLLDGLDELEVQLQTLDLFQLVLEAFSQAEYPRLASLSLSLDDSAHEIDTSLNNDSEAGDSDSNGESGTIGPCGMLLELLPRLKSLLRLDLKLRTSARAPGSPSPAARALQLLEFLSVDLASIPETFPNGSSDNGPVQTDIESESYLVTLLSLPHPSRLHFLQVSATIITPISLSRVATFTSLTSLILRFEPDALSNSLDYLVYLLSCLSHLELLELHSTHSLYKMRHVVPTRSQLERFLTCLPTRLVSLSTHFDLTPDRLSSAIAPFLESRTSSRLESWSFYDRPFEERTLRRRTANYEFVLRQMVKEKGEDESEVNWKAVSRHYSLKHELEYR